MIRGEKVILRAIERTDLERCHRWINDPEVSRYLQVYLPVSLHEEEKWIENPNQEGNLFAIEVDGTHIGNCGLHNIDWKNRHAELGILIGEKDFQNRGYGTDTVKTLLRFGFLTLGLHRIELRTYSYNLRAQKCYAKARFKKEGEMREEHFFEGKHHNTIVMSLLRDEYEG
jgi:RimJ/RimL family protein N-acetyltransferase